MKVYTAEWEKIFANHLSGKGPIPIVHKELSKLNSKKQIMQLENGQKT